MNETTINLLKEIKSPTEANNTLVDWRIYNVLNHLGDLLTEQILEQRKQTKQLDLMNHYLYEISMDIKMIKDFSSNG